MSVIKCKMCGGSLEVTAGASVATCEYCNTTQTLPRLDSEKKATLYDRANHFRRNNDYDKAIGIYEQILNEDNTDAEAYWSLVLCKYGVEYVEDPLTHKRIPTCNRTQFTSILTDQDYKSALEHADLLQKEIYQEEAHAIDKIQKGILEVSQTEEPFDVFICYKETDKDGRRTRDSVLAQDLYYQLKEQGFKVFFSRITLEDKLGTAYEPYIFAALNSSKVMVVVGTKPEYFNAVWVKNEWSRYLSLIKGGARKVLIPAYKDMDPYDLPDEFSHLQAQDMSKLGFMQDLVRGIKKLTNKEVKPVVKEVVVNNSNTNTSPLLRRAYLFLEDSNWQDADEYGERVLDIDPECAEAYIVKLLAELHLKKDDDLENCSEDYSTMNNFSKALRFANAQYKAKLEGYVETSITNKEIARCESLYDRAEHHKELGNFELAIDYLQQIPQYKNCRQLAEDWKQQWEISKKEAIYKQALEALQGSNFSKAIELFEQIADYKDSEQQIEICKQREEQAHLEEIYQEALEWVDYKSFDKAIELFEQIADYKDSTQQIEICKQRAEEERVKRIYSNAVARVSHTVDDIKLKQSISELYTIRGYKDTDEVIEKLTARLEKWYVEKEEERQQAERLLKEREIHEQKMRVIKKRVTFAGVIALALTVVVVCLIVFIPIVEINSRGGLKLVPTEDSYVVIGIDENYDGNKSNIIVPSEYKGKPVTTISDYAFLDCKELTSITIPDSIISIGASSFKGCTNLNDLTIGSEVKSIGASAFYDCSSLANLTIPDSVTSIGASAFYNCSRLTSVAIPDSVESIGEFAFYNCSSLTSITIPNSVVCVEESTFYGCLNLRTVTIEDGVTEIGFSAFKDCHSLTSVSIPNSVTNIDSYAFSNCFKLASISIPSNVTRIGNYAFSDCDSLTSVAVPGSLANFGEFAFNGCDNLKTVTIQDGVESIGTYAFYGCGNLTDVSIPDSVTSIGKYAFYGCSSLANIVIPDSVTTLEPYTFANCSKLESVEIPNSVKSIGKYAFNNCIALTSISIPASVTSIEDCVFLNCINLESIVIPYSVESIGYASFNFCGKLKKVFYDGTVVQWSSVQVGDYNSALQSSTFYYYKATQPTAPGNYWHYVDGVPTKW